jgi:hypothetical protein
MATKNTKNETAGAALATTDGNAALATTRAGDLLADVFGDAEVGFDGLDEVGSEDIKISARIFNFKGKDPKTGRAIPIDTFFDTVDETTQDTITATLLSLHKTNAWTEYVEAEGKTKTHCKSFDRVTGTMENGAQRPCEDCPDAQWRNEGGKRKRNCGPVYNVVGIDEEGQKAFLIRFKRTSLDAFKQFLNRYFLGKRVVGGKRANYPLFAFKTIIGLKLSEDGKYSLPVLRCEEDERNQPIPHTREKILDAQEQAKFYNDVMLPVLEKLADKDTDAGAGEGGPGFDAKDFLDGDPKPAAGPAPAANEW